MAALKLKSLAIRNWLKIRQAEITFPSQGLVLVAGSNRASNGAMESVGAGKTSVGEAICRALFGITGRYSNAGYFSTDEQGDSLVTVKADLNGDPLVVEYGYKCQELSKTGEGLRFNLKGQEIWRNHIRNTRDELAATINVLPELAAWTIFLDGEKINFDNLPQRQAVDLLMAALGQPPWTRFHEQARKALSEFKQSSSEARALHQSAETSLETAREDLGEAQRELEEAKVGHDAAEHERKQQLSETEAKLAVLAKEMTTLEGEKVKISKRLKKIEDEKAEKYQQLEVRRGKLAAERAKTNRARETALLERNGKKGELTRLNGVLEEMLAVPTNCPTCGAAWDRQHKAVELDYQRDKIVAAKKAFNEAQTHFTEADAADTAAIKAETANSAELDGLRVDTTVRELSRSYKDVVESKIPAKAEAKANLERRKASLERPTGGLEALRAKVDERGRLANLAAGKVSETAGNLAEAEAAENVVSYWAEAFSPTGIPNMVLEQAIPPLNEVSRRLSNQLSRGTIAVSYTTNTITSSGADKSELAIKVDNTLGSRRLQGNSKGEAGLANLIVAETLAEVGGVANRVGFQWMDEVVKTQDAIVRQAVFSYLREKARRLGILIFIVDHAPEAANYADHVLLVEKFETETRLSWTNSFEEV